MIIIIVALLILAFLCIKGGNDENIIKRVAPELFVCRRVLNKTDFYFCLERFKRNGEKKDNFWVMYAESEQTSIRNGGAEPFKQAVNIAYDFPEFEIWIAYISMAPVSKPTFEISPIEQNNLAGQIVMVTSVSSAAGVPFSTHMGIFKTQLCSEIEAKSTGKPITAGLAMPLHSFIAKITPAIYEHGVDYMATTPTKMMRDGILAKVKSGQFWVHSKARFNVVKQRVRMCQLFDKTYNNPDFYKKAIVAELRKTTDLASFKNYFLNGAYPNTMLLNQLVRHAKKFLEIASFDENEVKRSLLEKSIENTKFSATLIDCFETDGVDFKEIYGRNFNKFNETIIKFIEGELVGIKTPDEFYECFFSGKYPQDNIITILCTALRDYGLKLSAHELGSESLKNELRRGLADVDFANFFKNKSLAPVMSDRVKQPYMNSFNEIFAELVLEKLPDFKTPIDFYNFFLSGFSYSALKTYVQKIIEIGHQNPVKEPAEFLNKIKLVLENNPAVPFMNTDFAERPASIYKAEEFFLEHYNGKYSSIAEVPDSPLDDCFYFKNDLSLDNKWSMEMLNKQKVLFEPTVVNLRMNMEDVKAGSEWVITRLDALGNLLNWQF